MEKFIDSAVDYFWGVINLISEPLGWVVIVICVIVGLLIVYGEVILDKIFSATFSKILGKVLDFYHMLLRKMFGQKGEKIGSNILSALILSILFYLIFIDIESFIKWLAE